MEIPVLLKLQSRPELRDAAEAMMNLNFTSIPSGPSEIPSGFNLDTEFAPIPLGSGGSAFETFAAISSGQSESYLVRGSMDSEKLLRSDDPRIFSDPGIGLMPICPGASAEGTSSNVRGLLKVDELQSNGKNGEGVAVAIVDTGINLQHLREQGLSPKLDMHLHWSPTPNIRAGRYPVDHGTMCAYDVMIAAPECTLLDFPVLRSTRTGGSTMDGLLSDAVIAYSPLLQMMRTPKDQRPYHALVVSNSWGMFHPSWDFPAGHSGRYADNPNHPFNVIVGALASAGADIVFAAGNCGADCPDGRCRGVSHNITGANSHPDVLCVAGNDIHGDRVGYSSQGPGALENAKPDLMTYTHFVGSEAYGQGSPDGGTSTACPVAAGCIAALRTNTPPESIPPADIFEALRISASGTGWNADQGYGQLNVLDAARNLGIIQ